jgi:hypothetical protein
MDLPVAPSSSQLGADLRLDEHPSGPLRELASGVDAPYLSGHCELSTELTERLVRAREIAEAVHQPLPFTLGGLTFGLAPHGWQRYRYLLCHETGRIGFSTSGHLPAVRVQPKAELLHAVGPAATVAGYQHLLATDCKDLRFSVNRVDLFSDWQGWALDETHRRRFSCRAGALRSFEEGGAFRGFEFGCRSTKTLTARIYDKSAEIAHSGADWWTAIWGERHVLGVPVHRVEFEIGRKAITDFNLDTPPQVLAAAGDIWRYATGEWLTYRLPAAGTNRSRRPVAPEWLQVQQASLADEPVGIDRVAAGRRSGSLRRLFPGLAGYLAGFAVAVGTEGIEDTLVALDRQLRNDEIARRVPFPERIKRRRAELTTR